METFDAIDLFAGPGGWDVAARDLGLKTVGIEQDPAACETRRASGLATAEADVRALSHRDFALTAKPGLKASPPCQPFSAAGNGSGRRSLEQVIRAVKWMAIARVAPGEVFEDERTGLVLEPLRWALRAIDAGKPFEWLAFEQVPGVLPVWEHMAHVLRQEGYSVATGKLSAEEFGVPQTRTRAFLVARLHGHAQLPEPTHRKYRKGVAQHEGGQSLKPWVSMAEALGWVDDRTVVSNYGTGGDPSKRGERTSAEPAATVTGKVDRNRVYRTSTMPRATVRGVDEPAPTIAFGNDAKPAGWESADKFERITAAEAATLQTFPAGHQWRGTKTQVFQQIGNAVPPMLAKRVIMAATDSEV